MRHPGPELKRRFAERRAEVGFALLPAYSLRGPLISKGASYLKETGSGVIIEFRAGIKSVITHNGMRSVFKSLNNKTGVQLHAGTDTNKRCSDRFHDLRSVGTYSTT
jgi:hypothetical protein